MRNSIRKYSYWIILAFLSIALFQIFFATKALKFDNASQIFIFSNYLSQCVQADIFPYWNPYLHLGSPFFGDLVSRFHYPVIWFFAYTTGYSFFSLHLEFVLVFVGVAFGAYKIFRLYSPYSAVNVSFSIVLALSGFMTGHSQHLWIITSFCFFVWSIYFILQIVAFNRRVYCIPLSISLAFSLLGGYAPMCFIQFYIYLVFCMFLILKFKNYRAFLYLAISAALFFLLCSGYFYALYLTFAKITRTHGVDLTTANSQPFSPWSFVTFLNPGFLISDAGLFQTDLSMRNAYTGVFMLPLVYIAFKFLSSRMAWIILFIILLFFGFSLGYYTPLRTWLYEFVPLMNYFNYSAIFRFVPITILVFLSWYGLYCIYRHALWDTYRKLLFRFLLLYLVSVLCIAYFFSMYTNSLHRFLEFLSILTLFPFVAMVISIYSLKKLRNNDYKLYCFCFFIILDMVGTTQVLAPQLMYNRLVSAYQFQHYYQKYNRSFDFIPQRTIKEYSHYANVYIDSFLVNGNFILKTPSIYGYNNYKLRKYYALCKHPEILKQRFIFTSDTQSKVILTRFSPNQMTATIYAQQEDTCFLLQNLFRGWSARINKQSVDLLDDDYFPKVKLHKGENKVEFNYALPMVRKLHFFQLAFLSLLVFLFFFIRYFMPRYRRIS